MMTNKLPEVGKRYVNKDNQKYNSNQNKIDELTDGGIYQGDLSNWQRAMEIEKVKEELRDQINVCTSLDDRTPPYQSLFVKARNLIKVLDNIKIQDETNTRKSKIQRSNT